MVDMQDLLTPVQKRRWVLVPGYVSGNFKLVRFLSVNSTRTNKKWIMECLTCGTQRSGWSAPFQKGEIKCKICSEKLKKGNGGLELAQRLPLAVLGDGTFHVLWDDTLDAEKLHKKYGNNLYKAINSWTFVKWIEGVMDKPVPPSPELPSTTPTVPEGAIVTPARFVDFLVGAGDSENPEATEFFVTHVQKGNPNYYPTLRRVLGVEWMEGGQLMSYVLPGVPE